MSRKIFVNLPVRDLDQSKSFFSGLGFTFNPQFTNDEAACMVISEDIFAMLVTHPKFKEFTPKDISDAAMTTEVLVCLSCDSRGEVDQLAEKALATGGKPASAPQDHGFMYGRSFQDPDGHIWELYWMDESSVEHQG